MWGVRRVAAGGLVVLLALLAGCDGDPGASGSPSGSTGSGQANALGQSSSTPSPPPRTDAGNARAAALESERTLELAPLPADARRLPGQPHDWPTQAGTGMSPSNSRLTRTAWFTVPATADAVQQFFVRHHPRGMLAEQEEGVGYSTGVRTYDYRTVRPRDPAAYTTPWLLVQWYGIGPSTAIRFDAMLASRRARPPATLLPSAVTSVDIDRLRNHFEGAGSSRVLSTARLTADSDPAAMSRVVAALNGLYGDAVSDSMHTCPFLAATTTYRFVVHTADGDVTYQWADPCDPQIDVTRAGKPFGPSLSPGDLYDTVTQILASPRPDR